MCSGQTEAPSDVKQQEREHGTRELSPPRLLDVLTQGAGEVGTGCKQESQVEREVEQSPWYDETIVKCIVYWSTTGGSNTEHYNIVQIRAIDRDRPTYNSLVLYGSLKMTVSATINTGRPVNGMNQTILEIGRRIAYPKMLSLPRKPDILSRASLASLSFPLRSASSEQAQRKRRHQRERESETLWTLPDRLGLRNQGSSRQR